MCRYVCLVVALLASAACSTMKNTPAQDLAWQRIEKCQGTNSNVILQRVESDGKVWVELRNGTVGLAEWQACMAKAAQEQRAGAKP